MNTHTDDTLVVHDAQKQYDLAGSVIGYGMKVHSCLGPGFLESIYLKALAHELKKAGLFFETDKKLEVIYDKISIGTFIPDIIVENSLVVELKAIDGLSATHEVQVVNYLTTTGINDGLLLNFGTPSLQYRRKFRINPMKPS